MNNQEQHLLNLNSSTIYPTSIWDKKHLLEEKKSARLLKKENSLEIMDGFQ